MNLNLITQGAEHIYLACGPTDFRKQIEGLAALVSLRYHLEPYSPACVLLFCDRKKNCLKALRFDKDGFLLATKNCFQTWSFNGQSLKKRSGTSRPSRSDYLLVKASAAIPRIYRLKFQRDIYKDLRILEKSIGEGDEWLDGFNTFSIHQVLSQLIELWGLNVKTDVEAKKTSPN